MTDPPCWAVTLACYVLFNRTDGCTHQVGVVADACHNAGVVLMVTALGQNHYCNGHECTNEGLILMVGQSDGCFGNGVVIACVADDCRQVDERR